MASTIGRPSISISYSTKRHWNRIPLSRWSKQFAKSMLAMGSFSASRIFHPFAQRIFMGDFASKSKEVWRMCGKSSTSTWPLAIRLFPRRLLMATNALSAKNGLPYGPTASRAWWPKKWKPSWRRVSTIVVAKTSMIFIF